MTTTYYQDYRAKNREKIQAYQRQWRLNHPDYQPNVSHEIRRDGDPYINLCFAILVTAKHDKARLWREFKREQSWRRGIYQNQLDIALWICQEIMEEA